MRDTSIFDNRAKKVAKCRNQKFTGKSIRNDVMLYRGGHKEVNPSIKLIASLLNAREAVWTESQKIKMKERIEEKMKKTSKVNEMIKRLLNDCKSCNGPVT